MSDATVPRPDSEVLEEDLAPAAAAPDEDGPAPELDPDRLTHLLLTAWTMVLEEEKSKP